MHKYDSVCALCNYTIKIEAQHKDMNEVELKISSECPNLRKFINTPIHIDAINEVINPKDNSRFYQLLKQHHSHIDRCTAYDSLLDCLGKSLGRYYELA
ncbi:MAG: hypothetical protein GX024_05525 [Clostridiales bacterium]|jgi:hypothetical protein|nr:hypothetical protein [Clostridiales bacterium]